MKETINYFKPATTGEEESLGLLRAIVAAILSLALGDNQ
jgi:hypothetical protein